MISVMEVRCEGRVTGKVRLDAPYENCHTHDEYVVWGTRFVIRTWLGVVLSARGCRDNPYVGISLLSLRDRD